MENIKKHFSKTVDDYDTVVDKVVFKNNELHGELVKAISFDKGQNLKVLDLGCGTGHGMNLIAQKFSSAEITGIDFSSTMISKSKCALSSFSDRINLLEMDFMDYDFSEKFDVIVSAIAIHNITHEQKKVLFKKIFKCLNDGGLFINADFYEHDSENINDGLKRTYESFLAKNLSGDELAVWLNHAFKEDMPMKLSDQSVFLKDTGFNDFELLWLFNNQAVYVAKK